MFHVFFVAEGVLLVGLLAMIADGLYWLAQYERILVYVVRHHAENLERVNILVKRILLVQVVSVVGFICFVLSIRFAPELFFVVFGAVFIVPIPLYIRAMPSLSNYWNWFVMRESETFGDEQLHQMRMSVMYVCKKILRVAVFITAIGIGLNLVGIILFY